MKLKQSKQPEVIRLHEIDRSYRTHLYHTFTEAMESLTMNGLLPKGISRNYSTLLKVLNDAVYNYLTIYRKPRKTFGEEYTYLNMLNESDYEYEGVPVQSKRRLLLFVLSTFFPALLKRFLRNSYTEMLAECKTNTEKSLAKAVLARLPEFDDLVDKLDKFILMLFLIRSDYYNLIERFLRIKYIYMRHFKETTIEYRKEGWIMLAQMALEMSVECYHIFTIVKSHKQSDRSEGRDAAPTQPSLDEGRRESATC
jgi:hypothetical protein